MGLVFALLLQDVAWKEFRSPEGNFSVQLPGAATQEKLPLNVAGVEVQSSLVSAESGTLTCLVSVTPYPPGEHDAARILSTTRAAFLRGVKGVAGKERVAELGDLKGTACPFVSKELGLRGEIRLYFTFNRLYQVVTMGTGEAYSTTEAVRCLDSFKLLNPPKK